MSKFKEYLNKVYKEYEGEEEEDEDALELDGKRSMNVVLVILQNNLPIGKTKFYSANREMLRDINDEWNYYAADRTTGPATYELYEEFLQAMKDFSDSGEIGSAEMIIPFAYEEDANENRIRNLVREECWKHVKIRPATKDIHLFVYKKKPGE